MSKEISRFEDDFQPVIAQGTKNGTGIVNVFRALDVLTHILYELGLEKDINAYSAEVGPDDFPWLKLPTAMGVWDFSRLCLSVSAEDVSGVRSDIRGQAGAVRPCAACLCCRGPSGALPPRSSVLNSSLKQFHDDIAVSDDGEDEPPLPEFLKVSDAAALMNVSTVTVRRLVKDGELKAFRLGEKRNAPFRIRATDLQEFTSRNQVV